MDYVRVASTRTFLIFYHIGHSKFGKGYDAHRSTRVLYAENAVNGILAIAIERRREQKDKIETVEN